MWRWHMTNDRLGLHLASLMEKRNVERSTTEIVDDDLGFTTLLVKTIGNGGGGGRLVDDAKDLEVGNGIERGMEISFVARSPHRT